MPAENLLYVRSDRADQFLQIVWNEGNNVNRKGINIRVGTYDASGTNYPIEFSDGDGTSQGAITFSGGTVSYGAFTANHDVSVPGEYNENGYPYGTLVCIVSAGVDLEQPRKVLYNVEACSEPYSKKVLGAYAGKYEDKENLHQVYVLGDGHIRVNGQGGNLAVGDPITTSFAEGIGMKATTTGITIGYAQQNYTFASSSEVTRIAVQYGLGYPRLSPKIVGGEVVEGAFTDLDSIYSRYYSTSTPAMVIDELGNVGIGYSATSTFSYNLQVAGSIAAQSFVNISTSEAKRDITFLGTEDYDSILQKIASTSIATYYYKNEQECQFGDDISENSGRCAKRLGLIAEETPAEILAAGGKGVDIYKMTSFTMAGLKSLAKQFEELKGKLSPMLEGGKITGNESSFWSVEQVTGRIKFITALDLNDFDIINVRAIRGSFGRWSIDESGKLIVQEVETEKLAVKSRATFGSQEKRIGITIYDEDTGVPYCIKIKGGQMLSVAGECGAEAAAVVNVQQQTIDNQTTEQTTQETTQDTTPSDRTSTTTQEIIDLIATSTEGMVGTTTSPETSVGVATSTATTSGSATTTENQPQNF